MSKYYLNYDVDRMIEQRQGSYLVLEEFKASTRLELKWAYVAMLNLLLDQPQYNSHQEAYLDLQTDRIAQALAVLMNKKVDEAKVQKYLDELIEADLLDIIDQKCYLKRMI